MLTKQQTDWLDVGVEHFNEGRFWHAHEDWEALWISLKGNAGQELIDGVQGIIQVAAMLLNHQRKKANIRDWAGTGKSHEFRSLARQFPESIRKPDPCRTNPHDRFYLCHSFRRKGRRY